MAFIFALALYLSVLIVSVTGQDYVALERDDGYYSASRLLVASTMNQTVTENWCISQMRVCRLLCNFDLEENLCWSDDISCTCICKSKVVPDLALYLGSLPALVNSFVLQSDDCASDVAYCKNITMAALSPSAPPETLPRTSTQLRSTVTVLQGASTTSLPRLSSNSAAQTINQQQNPTQTSESSQLGSQSLNRSSGLSTGATVGIGVGCAAGALLVAGIAIFLYRRGVRVGQRKSMLGNNFKGEAELNGAGVEAGETKDSEAMRQESEARRERVVKSYVLSGWGPGGHELPALDDGQTPSKSGDEITEPDTDSRNRGP